MSKRKNIVLVVMDGCRADRVGAYGYRVRDTSPNFDRLADRGILGCNSYSTSFCTMPAIVSAMTGVYPCVHRATATWGYYDGNQVFLPDALRSVGYQTFGIANNTTAMSPEWGFVRGYDRYYQVGRTENWFRESKEVQRGTRKPSRRVILQRKAFSLLKSLSRRASHKVRESAQINWAQSRDMGGARAVFCFEKILKERDQSRPFFAYINLPETHHPFITTKPFVSNWGSPDLTPNLLNLIFYPNQFEESGADLSADEFATLQLLYDACVLHVDHLFGRVLALLKDAGLSDDTIVAVIGDHGGNTWERNRFYGSTCFTYEAEIKVPMLVFNAGASGSVGALTSLVDLMPTLLEAIDAADLMEEPIQGKSLFRSDRGHDWILADYPAYPNWLKQLNLTHPRILLKYGNLNRTMVRSDGSKFIWQNNGLHERYNLARDPGETNNLFSNLADDWEAIERLRQAYEGLLGPSGRNLEIYPHNDVGENMSLLPAISIVNPEFDFDSVRVDLG